MTTTETPAAVRRTTGVADALIAACPGLCLATPCGTLAPLLAELERRHPRFSYAHREDNAVAWAAGAALAGRRPLVLMQNSGLGQSVNVLASLVRPFRTPVRLVVGMRGTGCDHTTENTGMGLVTAPLLERLGIPFRVLDERDPRGRLEWFAGRSDGPAALLVAPSFLGWGPQR